MEKDLPPGRKLDALIAEKVMGWRYIPTKFAPSNPWINEKGVGFQELKPYSTDIAAAWEVVEALRLSFNFVELSNHHLKECWEVTLEQTPGPVRAMEDSAPHAICLAALRAVGENIKRGEPQA